MIERLGSVRRHSAVLRIVEIVPGTPLTTAANLQHTTVTALSSITAAVARLEKAAILRPLNLGRKRDQVYEAREIVDAFTDLERGLASPADDTRIEPLFVPCRTALTRSHGGASDDRALIVQELEVYGRAALVARA